MDRKIKCSFYATSNKVNEKCIVENIMSKVKRCTLQSEKLFLETNYWLNIHLT